MPRLEHEFTKIKVYPGPKGVRYDNPTNLKFIGRGYTGAVFKLTDEKCVKIYVEERSVEDELKALEMGQSSPIIPKLYEVGPNYIVMEYIKGETLSKYLKKNKFLSDDLSEEILYCLKEIKNLGFPRIDIHLRHFILTQDKKLKVIDHANVFKEDTCKPRQLFKQLKRLGLLSQFLGYVKKVDYKIYKEWVRK